MADQHPRYLSEVVDYISSRLDQPAVVAAALLALLTDPDAYKAPKGQPTSPVVDYASELALADPDIRAVLLSGGPLRRTRIEGKWAVVWKGSRIDEADGHSKQYDVCISFAGEDREVARKISEHLTTARHRKVFYDDYESVHLWGEDLIKHLYSVYSERSQMCIILFSHAYLAKAWTRHELRAAQTRALRDQRSYIFPVALDAGAIPEEFATIAHWRFASGDEERLAEAVDDRFGEYLARYWATLEEVTEIVNRNLVQGAILEGFRRGIDEKKKDGDQVGAEVLRALACAVAADLPQVDVEVRALIELVLFSPGAIGDAFDMDDNLHVFASASVKRCGAR